MGNDGCIEVQSADSDSRAYLKETLTEQSFCVAMLCAAFSPRSSKWEAMRKVLAKFTHELKTPLCFNTRATDPVRQSALRSQTSRLSSTILLKSAERCINRTKDDGDWHIFFLRACILSYVRVYIRKHAQRLRPRAFNEGAH